MKNIRKGNDIHVLWRILDGSGSAYNLEGRDVSLHIKDQLGDEAQYGDLTITGNLLDFFFYGKDQKSLGKHTFILVENEGQEGMHTVDILYAVNLVAHTCQEGGEEACSHVTTEVLELTSETEIGVGGPVGPAAGFGTVDAEVDNNVGTPAVEVETSGPDTAKNFHFKFKNIKGQKGDEPVLTAGTDGTIYSDGQVLTEVIKDAKTQAAADHTQAGTDHTTAASDHQQAESDHQRATNDHNASSEATTKAGNVNATVSGTTVTITDRNGVSTSVDIGFEIYKTYASVAAMNADAANVAEGKFVMIATTDTTSSENARLYVRNENAASSESPFTFLCDLDQAASSAWADWFNNYKPTIEADHTRAENDHTTASNDHTTAGTDHTQAGNDHTRAESDHGTASSDHTTAGNDHTRAESDHTRAEADHASIADKVSQEEMAAALANKANINGTYKTMAVGLADNLAGDNSMPAEYLFRKIPDGVSAGLAQLRSVKGKSLAWNQQIKTSDIPSNVYQSNPTTQYTKNSDGSITVYTNGELASREFAFISTQHIIGEHKVYVNLGGNTSDKIGFSFGEGGFYGRSAILTVPETYAGLYIFFKAGLNVSSSSSITFTVNLIDLTLMFGAGNEPTTVAEFEALFPAPYYANNAGTIINNKAEKIVTVGFNQWDEEWEEGNISTTDGTNVTEEGRIRSKNLIPVFPGVTYYAHCGGVNGSYFSNRICYYDANGNFISGNASFTMNLEFTIPDNCHYIKFSPRAYGATYNHDICINFSNASLNGTYKPYEKHELELNLTTLTGKLNGEGESAVIAPDGLKSAGTADDYGVVENGYLTKVVKRVGMVDLGTLLYESFNSESANTIRAGATLSDKALRTTYDLRIVSTLNYYIPDYIYQYDVVGVSEIKNTTKRQINVRLLKSDVTATDASFKAALNGVELVYELAEPLVYVLDTPVYVGYETDGSAGTESILPEGVDTNGVPKTAPFVCETSYPVDAVGFIGGAPKNYQSQDSMDTMLTALGTALGFTWSKTWDASNSKWTYTFTPNA